MHCVPLLIALIALAACSSTPEGDGNEAEFAARAKALEAAADKQAEGIINEIVATSREQAESEATETANSTR